MNPFRYALSADYRRTQQTIARFRRSGGEGLLLDFDPPAHSIIIEGGGFRGAYALAASTAFPATTIHTFEPIPEFADDIREKCASRGNVHVHAVAMGGTDGQARFELDGDATSATSASEGVLVEMRDVAGLLDELTAERVFLLTLNIEGAEYTVLDRLIEVGLIERVDNLLVQFHRFQPDHKQRYASIAGRLPQTHSLAWRFPWIWERWSMPGDRDS